jgi:hypothetical protein
MMIRCGYGLRMIVILAGHEAAYHKVPSLECLMHRRWLMHTAGDRLEVMYRKDKRIMTAIPSYRIKGMVNVVIWIEHILFLDVYEEVAFLIMSHQILRCAYIALAERRMLQQLPEVIPVALRVCDRGERLNDKQPVILSVKLYLIDRAARDHYIIAIAELQFAESCLELARTLMYEYDLIRSRVLIKVVLHRMKRRSQGYVYVFIDQRVFARLQIVLLRAYFKSPVASVLHVFFAGYLGCDIDRKVDLGHHGRRVAVIDERV